MKLKWKITQFTTYFISLVFYLDFEQLFFAVSHTVDEEKEEEKKEVTRLDEFGDWLDQDQEDLPEEFRLNVER